MNHNSHIAMNRIWPTPTQISRAPGLRLGLATLLFLAGPVWAAPGPVQRYDFQPTNGPVAAGFTRVTPGDLYSAGTGFGFTRAPANAVDGSRHAWQIFDRLVPVSEAIAASVLSDATVDCVTPRGTNSFSFRADVTPMIYDGKCL